MYSAQDNLLACQNELATLRAKYEDLVKREEWDAADYLMGEIVEAEHHVEGAEDLC